MCQYTIHTACTCVLAKSDVVDCCHYYGDDDHDHHHRHGDGRWDFVLVKQYTLW